MMGETAARLTASCIFLMGLESLAAAQEALVEGVWKTQLASEITIEACPEGYCGHISKIVVPDHIVESVGAAAIDQLPPESYVDQNNKDEALRSRPIMGLRILTLEQSQDGRYFNGEIYNPEDGNTYSGYVEVLGQDAMRLNGCVLFNTLCRGEDWQRVPQPAP